MSQEEGLPVPTRADQRRSVFVRDTLGDGRAFRFFTLVDDCTRACPGIEVDVWHPGERVVRVLERDAAVRGYPCAIVRGYGPEFVSAALNECAHHH